MMNQIKETCVLMVEDDDGHADLVRWNLEKAGVENPIFRVDDGQKAIDFLLRKGDYADADLPSPDNIVMLLDINMPVINGYEVLKLVRANKQTKFMPIIMLTTAEDTREVTKCYELGCNLFLKKPIDHGELTSMIQQLGTLLAFIRTPSGGGYC